MAATALDLPARRPRVRRPGFVGDDDRLVTGVRHGDDAAFEALYDRYAPGLLAFCHHLLASRDDAEDALQHSLSAAYRMLRADDREVELRPWLYTVARNRCLSMLRARRPDVSLDTTAERGGRPDDLVDQVQRRADLRDLVQDLRLLPDEQRAALVLFELGGLSHDDIATVLDIRRDKVKALVFQAREGLMRARHARETPCTEMRRQLASLTGRIPKRSLLRRHVDRCPSCALYQAEVGRQRAALALILPVPLSAGLKSTILGSVLGRGGAAVAGGGAGAGAGTAILGGGGGGAACAGAGGGGAAALAGASAGGGAAASGSLLAAGAAGSAGVSGAVATAGGAGTVAAALGAKGATAVVAKLVTVAAVVVGGGAAATGQLPAPAVPVPGAPAAEHSVPQVSAPAAAPAPTPALLAPDPVPTAPPQVLVAGTATPLEPGAATTAVTPAADPADGSQAAHAHTITTPATSGGGTSTTAAAPAASTAPAPAATTPDPAATAPAATPAPTTTTTATTPATAGGTPATDAPATGGTTPTAPAATGGTETTAPTNTTTTTGGTTTTDAAAAPPPATSDTGGTTSTPATDSAAGGTDTTSTTTSASPDATP
jgi:RNA polymerase sigma factor (sigma-70 family)